MLKLIMLLFTLLLTLSLSTYSKGSDVDPSKSDKVEIGCEDCHTISIKIPSLNQTLLIPCADPDSFCSSGHCDMDPDENCNAAKRSDFKCGKLEGIFPDGENCSIYHLCIAGEAYDYHCDLPKTEYSHKTKSCVIPVGDAKRCSPKICKERGEKISYSDDSPLYFVCVDGTPKEIRSCRQGENWNEGKNSCETKCTSEGPISNPNSDIGFIECVKNDTSYEMLYRACPNSKNGIKSKFNASKKYCTPV